LTCFSSSDTGNDISGGPIEGVWSRGIGIAEAEYEISKVAKEIQAVLGGEGMSAEELGKRLLGEVVEAGADEVS